MKMYSKVLLLSLLISVLFYGSDSNADCSKRGITSVNKAACGTGCTGTPSYAGKRCGNVDNMCYCDCDVARIKCKTTELGYTWNK